MQFAPYINLIVLFAEISGRIVRVLVIAAEFEIDVFACYMQTCYLTP